jgi:hypothetical protein
MRTPLPSRTANVQLHAFCRKEQNFPRTSRAFSCTHMLIAREKIVNGKAESSLRVSTLWAAIRSGCIHCINGEQPTPLAYPPTPC